MAEELIVEGESSGAKPEIPGEAARTERETTPAPETPVAHPEAAVERAEAKFDAILSQATRAAASAPPSDAAQVVSDTDDIAATVDEESRIQKLLDLAGAKGVPHAVRVARSLKDYYALDRMHDDLVDKLYQGLLAKGLIDQE